MKLFHVNMILDILQHSVFFTNKLKQ